MKILYHVGIGGSNTFFPEESDDSPEDNIRNPIAPGRRFPTSRYKQTFWGQYYPDFAGDDSWSHPRALACADEEG
jgi:hypothetical protein